MDAAIDDIKNLRSRLADVRGDAPTEAVPDSARAGRDPGEEPIDDDPWEEDLDCKFQGEPAPCNSVIAGALLLLVLVVVAVVVYIVDPDSKG
jgi:hypothetical protein